jgi:hypothetical protein
MARPVAGASVEGKDKTAPLSVDGVNRAVYINHTVYEDNPMTFQLDTTGAVLPVARYDSKWNAEPCGYRWSDLSPFTQGYIEALFADGVDEVEPGRHFMLDRPIAFRDLAPETLARIIADCGLACREGDAHMEGVDYWNRRQAGDYLTTRPPQTLQLCDDGKVRFA